MKRRRALVLLAAVAFAWSCGSNVSDPAQPSASAANANPAAAREYLDRILNIMQANSIHRLTIEWPTFRQSVLAAAPNAATIAETYPAIRVALGLLGDHHSFLTRPDGTFVTNPSPRGGCEDPRAPAAQVPATIGYVKVGSFSGTSEQSLQFALSIQEQIRAADSVGVVGWIVDLRGNGGGNMWPMVAGLGPVLGEGDAGQFVSPTGVTSTWGYADGSSYSQGARIVSVAVQYRLLRPDPRVAVLTDCGVASSGEASVIAFRRRPNTRSFGTPTYGLSTSNAAFPLSDGAQLYLTTSVMADRTGARYGDVVVPDEVVRDPAQTVQRAADWLRAGGSASVAKR